MVIDTGSGRNLIGEHLYKKMFSHKAELKQTKKRFYPDGQKTPLKSLGYFKAQLAWQGNVITRNIYVIKGNVEALTAESHALH